MSTTVSKWLVTLGLAVAGGLIAYSVGHKGPPLNLNDGWDLLIVILTTAGLGASGKGVNKAIDNSQGKP